MAYNMDTENIEKNFKKLQILWGCSLGTLLIFVLIGHFYVNAIEDATNHQIVFQGHAGDGSVIFTSRENVLAGISLFMFIFAWFGRKIIIDRKLAPNYRFRGVKPAYLGTYFSAVLLSSSALQAAGATGLVHASLTRSLFFLYLFNIAAAVEMYLLRPDREEFEGLAEEKRSPIHTQQD